MDRKAACPNAHDLQQFLFGLLPEADGEILAQHMETCAACAAAARSMQAADNLVDSLRADASMNSDPMPSKTDVDRLVLRIKAMNTASKAGGIETENQEGTSSSNRARPRSPTDEFHAILAPAQNPDEMGWFGLYRVIRVLGAGGMGVVFQAEDPRLKRSVALKVMKPSLAADVSARERFIREAQAAAAIEHDHIVAIHHVDEHEGVPFLVMPLLQGESLEDRLRREPPLCVAEILHIGHQIALGLAAAHGRALIHRDIKPANIWLETLPREGGKDNVRLRIRILDFGLARHEDVHGGSLTGSGVIVGTPSYMSPEQARGEKLDARADLFSLGCVLYRMTTGTLPFQGPTVMAILASLATETPRSPMTLNPQTPPDLSSLIDRLLAKDMTNRPASANAVVAELAILEQAGGSAKATDVLAPLPRVTPAGKRRRRWPAVLIAALLVVLGVIFAATTLIPKPLPNSFTNSIGMKFVLVPKGRFLMGGSEGKLGKKEIEVQYDFYLGVYEVTQEAWEKVTEENPNAAVRREGVPNEDLKQFPVTNVTWNGTQVFLKKLNAREKDNGWVYRLPTEVEWEYACRGGSASNNSDYAFDFYLAKPTNELLPDQANFDHKNGLKRPCKVGSYRPNRLGLYDMHGNVWEWCDDAELDADEDYRVSRGGSFKEPAAKVRTVSRDLNPPDHRGDEYGLRIARVPLDFAWHERNTGKWVLTKDGEITIREAGRERKIVELRNLPADPFELVGIDFGSSQNIGNDDLEKLNRLTNLRTLNLKKTHVSSDGLVHLKKLSNLNSLNVNRTAVGDDGLAHLKKLTKLEELLLDDTRVGDEGLVHLKSLTNLNKLQLDRTQVSNAGLVALETLTKIRYLTLSKTEVGDEGLAHVMVLTNLIHLDLNGTKVGDTGLAHLKTLKHLAYLDLRDTKVGDAGLAHLEKLYRLTEVKLERTNVTSRGIGALHEAMPKCKIDGPTK